MPHPVYIESEPQGAEFVVCVSIKFQFSCPLLGYEPLAAR